ncbi:MAG: hypothetical protein JSS78_08485 [Bacteroidetes bacterium]|nr:hypothetical protein [Bacteroidota bacterium]
MNDRTRYKIGCQWFALIILCGGVAIRFVEWFHCRDLMMDEVNVVRNIFERPYGGLFRPLVYEQFAPPLFLSMIKLSSSLWGFGEMSLRIFPILCSVLSLFVFYRLVLLFASKRSLWYPLAIFSFAEIYIQYANDVKQYSSDILVSLLLVFLAVKRDLFASSRFRFFIQWSLIGMITVWLSMPAIFILTGVGFSLFIQAYNARQIRYLLPLIGAGILWMLSFSGYYWLLLRHQIASEYLQAFHAPYFLNLSNGKDLIDSHNIELMTAFFSSAIGSGRHFPFFLNLIFLIVGFYSIFRNNVTKGLVLLIPIFCFVAAVALHRFTLLPRVGLFVMPLLLIVIGVGLDTLLTMRVWLQCLTIAACVISAGYAQQLRLFTSRIEIDELTKEIAFARKNKVAYHQIFLPELYEPSLIYYKRIHPNKTRAKSYDSIQILKWKTNYSALRSGIVNRSAFLYFWMDDGTMQRHRDSIFSFFQPIDSFVQPSYKVFVFDQYK